MAILVYQRGGQPYGGASGTAHPTFQWQSLGFSGDPATDAVAGGLATIQIKVNRAITALAAGLPTEQDSRSKMFQTFEATSGGLVTLTFDHIQVTPWDISADAIAGGLTTVQLRASKFLDSLAGALPTFDRSEAQYLLSFMALAGALPERQLFVHLHEKATAGGLTAVARLVSRSFNAIGAGLTAVALKVSRAFAAVAAGLPAITFPVTTTFFVGVNALCGGLANRQIKANKALTDLAAGIPYLARRVPQAVVALAAGVADITFTVVGGISLTFSVVAGAVARVAHLPKIRLGTKAGALPTDNEQELARTAFSGGTGLGSVARPGGGWTSWKTKSRR